MANTLRFKRGLVSTIPTALAGEPLFTTDTFDLYIGNGTTNTRFQKYIASGTTSQLLRGDGSLLTMPIVLTSPANGQVLKYDGTNWVNSSDAGVTGSGANGQVTYWGSSSTITGSNNLFWDATNNRLGILTNTPTTSFHINSSTSTQGGAIFGKGGYNYATVSQIDSAADAIFGGGVIASATSGQVAKSVGDVGHYIKIQIGDGISFHTNITGTTGTSFARTINERARFTLGGNFLLGSTTDNGLRFQVTGDGYFSGNLGLGVSPATKLHVASAAVTGTINRAVIIANTSASGNGSGSEIYLGWNAPSTNAGAGVTIGASYAGAGTNMLFSTPSAIASAPTVRMTLDGSGNLGLGVTPSAWGSNSKPLQMADGSIWGSSALTGYVSVGGNYYYDGNYKYIKSSTATDYYQYDGVHAWRNAISGTANGTISFVQRMTLDASGNLGLGVVPSAWGSTFKALQIGLGTSLYNNAGGNGTFLGSNFFFNGTNNIYLNSTTASAYGQTGGQHQWFTAPSGTAGNAITFTQAMTLDASGRLLLGSGSVTSELLQVNGTMRVSGASTFGGLMTISGSATTLLQITSTGAAAYIGMGDSSGSLTYIGSDDGTFLVQTPGSSYSTKFSINSTGAATFSSSVTAANLLVNTTTNDGYVSVNGNNSSRVFYGQGGATFPSANSLFRLDAGGVMVFNMLGSGATTFSSSIQAGTAIAIGTTPDTNKPFKILKNINGTVGINFENTSTGSSAFSAIQMGTDVTGGTKFTNLVYSSSGVTASGVYQPDGTSLINNGSGGLNFLGNPIRMYTGGSNGTLRWDMTNDGFITQYSGTNPSTNATDGYRQYSADVVAGNAAPHFRTENGAIIKLYQETTAVGNSIISLGGGNAVLDDTTFDGYTLRQIVKALRNQGILA